ncbi:TPA: DUF551 domain-containing protein [Klebsiella pneumoniae]|nr:DUF551 domain-containing protein [Klebsiella pneumoniae]
MTSKLTRERLEKIKSWRETYGAGSNVMLPAEEAEELARMALAAMDSEPVAYIDKQWTLVYYVPPMSMGLKIGDKLYRHAQQPVVPDVMEPTIEAIKRILPTSNPDEYAACIGADMWNACRAAMLAAAPQSPGSEPATVPGKWIPVSERMPIEFEAVIAFDGDQVYGEAMYSSDDGFTIDGYEPCDRLNLQNVTHWMPLPAAPREVK